MAVRKNRFFWAKAIRNKWQESVECIIEVGRLLEQAKDALPYGQFQKMVEGGLPFGPRSARMLMAIARNPTLAERKFVSALPPSWGTLYEMSRLPEPDLERALTKGTLGPETRRRDVVQLRDQLRHEAQTKAGARTRSGNCTVADLDKLIETGKKYGTVYADPPWRYDDQGIRGSTLKHYDTMALEDIMALPVSALAAESSHLHLWTTSSFLFEAREVLEAWGFEYKSSFVWVKPELGLGRYWRVSHELLLLGVRGSLPFRDRATKSWLEQPRELHSSKPSRVRKLIEKVSPGPRIELFARTPAARGWTCWGSEVPRAEMEQAARSAS
jgi:N6-adenosine-specific RNA methylase IME4